MGTRTRSCRLSCAARPRSRASPWSLSLCARCSGRAWLPRPRGRRRRAGSVGRRAVRRRLEIDESAEWREEVFVLRKDMAAWANATGTRAGDKPISARNARDSWRGTVSCAGQTQARERGRAADRRTTTVADEPLMFIGSLEQVLRVPLGWRPCRAIQEGAASTREQGEQ